MSNMQLATQLKRKVNNELPEAGINCHREKVGIPTKTSRNYINRLDMCLEKHAKQPSLDNFTEAEIDLPHLSSQ